MASYSEDEAHQHLLEQCPWYEHVTRGEEDPSDIGSLCRKDRDEGGALVKFTPHTAEASTQDKPTRPPGGPGLFRIKGRHLPPYIQHLWFHLKEKYGEHKAYQVAVGIVKKWAAGTNPGGKHPTKTHPDVRAAAARNVAQWEKDKADAHQDKKKVKATLALAHQHTAQAEPVHEEFPGSDLHETTPVPGFPASRQMYTAHRVNQLVYQLTHAQERIHAARKEKDESQRNYHVLHVANHLTQGIRATRQLADNLKANYPAEGSELDALGKVMALAKSLSSDAKSSTTAHLLQTCSYDLAHAKRHADAMVAKPGTPDMWGFNCDHCEKHVKGALAHAYKLAEHLHDNYPAEGKWLAKLEEHQSTQAERKPYSVKLADSAGHGGSREHELPSYPEISCIPDEQRLREVLARIEHARKHDGEEKSVAAEQNRLTALKDLLDLADANKPKGYPLPRTADRSLNNKDMVTAPGTRISAQLKHAPSQTVSPSPPLPPAVDIPTSAECEAAAKAIEADAPKDSDLLRGAVRQLRDAGVKLDKKEPVHALQSLRGAQMGILAAHYELRRNTIPVANVFTAAHVPPAAAASAHAAMAQSAKDRETFRKHYMTVSKFIDRIRRQYFHGMYGGWASARFSDSQGGTSLAGGKLSHDAVNYTTGTPEKHCGNCYMYSHTGHGDCALVSDPIEKGGVCDRWLPIPVETSDRVKLEQAILSLADEVD